VTDQPTRLDLLREEWDELMAETPPCPEAPDGPRGGVDRGHLFRSVTPAYQTFYVCENCDLEVDVVAWRNDRRNQRKDRI
jgi:hypothetical protein